MERHPRLRPIRAMILAILSVSLLAALPRAATAEPEDVAVFAAASLQEVIDGSAERLRDQANLQLTPVIGGSSMLARQVASGAPADLVVLAHADWMGWLADRGAIAPHTARDLASNRLVVIGPAGTAPAADMTGDLTAALPPGQAIATALTAEVPAGIYARQALSAAGLWESVQPQLVETDHVRAALNLVALGAVPRGIVYASDAQAEPRVRVVAAIDPALHEPIRIMAALPINAPDSAQAVLDWLAGPEGQALFEAAGFAPPAAQP